MEVLVVGDVAGQHVADEALLDGLAHRVQVERLVAAACTHIAEQFQGAALGGGGEGEERQVGLATPGGDRLCQQRIDFGRLQVLAGLGFGFGRAQGAAQFLGCLAGL